jgi:hypothetical protein
MKFCGTIGIIALLGGGTRNAASVEPPTVVGGDDETALGIGDAVATGCGLEGMGEVVMAAISVVVVETLACTAWWLVLGAGIVSSLVGWLVW